MSKNTKKPTVKKTLGAKLVTTTTLARPAPTLKLDLASGQVPADGFEGVDIFSGAKHVVNLMKYPWPFADESVAELRCSHFIEHIPMIYVNELGDEVPMGTPGAKDAWMRFFEECHRILVPDGWLEVIVPNARHNRAFQDPTHRRFHVAESFFYLGATERASMGLGHYNTFVNFAGSVNSTIMQELSVRAPEVQQNAFQKEWNAVLDWVVKLKKLPRVDPKL